jgi:hypothetical protein
LDEKQTLIGHSMEALITSFCSIVDSLPPPLQLILLPNGIFTTTFSFIKAN